MTGTVGLAFAQGSRLGSCDIAGAYGVALYVVAAVFRAYVAGKHFEAALCRRIRRYRFAAELAHHRADIYDFAVALFNHRGNDGLGNDEGRVEVYVDYLPEIGGRHLYHRYPLDYARIVDEYIDYPHFLFNFSHHLLHGGFVAHVADVAVGLYSVSLVRGEALVHKLLFQVAEDDFCARSGKSLCDGIADAVGAARNQGDFSVEPEIFHFHNKLFSLHIIFECTRRSAGGRAKRPP